MNLFVLSEFKELESSVSEILASDAGVVGVVVSGCSDVHTVVCLDIAAAGVVARDTSLSLLSERPARVVSADAVDSVDEDAGGLLEVSLGVPCTLDVVVSSVNLHQAPAVALATVAVTPSVLAVPGLESGTSSGLSRDDGTDQVVVDVLLVTGGASLRLVLAEVGPIVGSKSLRTSLATSAAVSVLKKKNKLKDIKEENNKNSVINKRYLVASSSAAGSADFVDAGVVAAFGSSRGDKKSSSDLHVDFQMNRLPLSASDFKFCDRCVFSQCIKSGTNDLVMRNPEMAVRQVIL